MAEIDYESLLKKPEDESIKERIGRACKHNIDKTACFYHVITKSNDGGVIFHQDSGDYRHSLLCRFCEEEGVTILFSVTMPSHTHDVFLTPSWEALAEVMRKVNLYVTKYLRRKNPKKYRQAIRIIRRYPAYIPIRDIVALFVCGKYVYDNPDYLRVDGKFIPHICFWMFEKEYFPAAYDGSIYRKLFGLSPRDILQLFSTRTARQVLDYAKEHFRDWTPQRTKAVFFRKDDSDCS